MNCRECKQKLPLIPDSECDVNDLKALIEHTDQCADCRAEMEKYTSLKSMLGSLRGMDDIRFNWEQFSAATHAKALKAASLQRSRSSFSPRSALHYAAALLIFAAGAGLFLTGLFSTENPAEQTPASKELNIAIDIDPPVKGSPLKPVSKFEQEKILSRRLVPVKRIVRDDLEKTNTREALRPDSWLGVIIRNFPNGYVGVVKVVVGSPAEQAGVLKGDVLLGLNKIRIKSVAALRNFLMDVPVGTQNTLHIYRNNKQITLTIETGKAPHQL